ncbi:hypothetical protein LTR94_036020, partial [Friedmanniomyces endolithicus]
ARRPDADRRRSRQAAALRLSRRGGDRPVLHRHRPAGTADADRSLPDPAETCRSLFQHLWRRADAVHVATDLGRGGDPRQRGGGGLGDTRLHRRADPVRPHPVRPCEDRRS